MTKIFIYIDESGTLPDPNDQFIVLAAVACQGSMTFKKKIKTTRSREVKFYNAGDRGRSLYLEFLVSQPVEIFTLVINKGSQKIPDTPSNYAVLSWLLLIDCLAYFQEDSLEIIFDRHFQRKTDEETLFKTLEKLLGRKLLVRSADSQKEPGVTAADMVAGAFLYSKSGKTDQFYQLIKRKVVSEKEINWKEAKKNFIEGLKNSPEPV